MWKNPPAFASVRTLGTSCPCCGGPLFESLTSKYPSQFVMLIEQRVYCQKNDSLLYSRRLQQRIPKSFIGTPGIGFSRSPSDPTDVAERAECIRKLLTKRFDFFCQVSTANFMDRAGLSSGTEASSGHADRSSTKTVDFTSTRLQQAREIIYRFLRADMSGMNSGIENSVEIKSKCREIKVKYPGTFRNMLQRAVR